MEHHMYDKIVTWYEINKRDLEFRKYKDPYAIWVSEIMAQQTQIVTMLPYFIAWMKAFPTIKDCAAADEITILKHWEGLGYYRRAQLLHQGCLFICENFDGVFPERFTDIKKIPGIGDYTAAAIASIAFNQKTPAIDGNVMRVVSRVLALDDYIEKTSTKQTIKNTVQKWMSGCETCDFGSFTQGLMEIGALVCTPKNPNCQACPLRMQCKSFQTNTQALYPKRKPRAAIPTLQFATILFIYKNKILFNQDDQDGLMKGLFRLPQVPLASFKLNENYQKMGELNHTFSHKKWNLHVYQTKHSDSIFRVKNDRFIQLDLLDEIPIITAHKKILKKYII
jgi:A/G-specific adenine glycosylase